MAFFINARLLKCAFCAMLSKTRDMNWTAELFLLACFGLTVPTNSASSSKVKGSVTVPADCLHCICMVESNCAAIGCKMDVGSLSCGYYQIKFPYWLDCYKPKPSGGCSGDTDCWKKCANDKACATKCVNSYMSRYIGPSGCKRNCESYARLHNGGPQGCKRSSTLSYWGKVKKCLKRVDTELFVASLLASNKKSVKL